MKVFNEYLSHFVKLVAFKIRKLIKRITATIDSMSIEVAAIDGGTLPIGCRDEKNNRK